MTKDFWKAAGIRALRTICQTAVAMIGTTAVISEVDWLTVGSASLLSGILSVLTSIATGLPEVYYGLHNHRHNNRDGRLPESYYHDGRAL